MIGADVTGLNRVATSLAISDAAVAAQAGRVVRTTAADVTATAKAFCPVGPTGNLRRSITHQVDNIPGGVEAVVGTNVEYGPYVEYGTYKMAPRAYLGPALDRHAHELVEGLARLGPSLLR